MITLSASTPRSIAQGRAPSALRMPNSLVLSFTVMSIMFEILTTPLISVSNPTTHNARSSIVKAKFCSFAPWATLDIHTALSSSSAKSWRAPKLLHHAALKASKDSSSSGLYVCTTISGTSKPEWKMVRNVVKGIWHRLCPLLPFDSSTPTTW